MAEQIGIITSVEPGGWARVIMNRKGACGGCHPGGGCHGCLASSRFEGRVLNSVGAQPGDLVQVSLASKDFLRGAAMLYLIPVVALMTGAVAGTWVAGRIGWYQTAGGVLGAAICLVLAALILIGLGRSRLAARRLTPTVAKVLSSNGLSQHSPGAGHACCT